MVGFFKIISESLCALTVSNRPKIKAVETKKEKNMKKIVKRYFYGYRYASSKFMIVCQPFQSLDFLTNPANLTLKKMK